MLMGWMIATVRVLLPRQDAQWVLSGSRACVLSIGGRLQRDRPLAGIIAFLFPSFLLTEKPRRPRCHVECRPGLPKPSRIAPSGSRLILPDMGCRHVAAMTPFHRSAPRIVTPLLSYPARRISSFLVNTVFGAVDKVLGSNCEPTLTTSTEM